MASYLPRQVLLDYVEDHMKKANVRDWINFNTVIRRINHDDAFGKFTVMAHNYNQDTSYSVEFNYIVVASWHFSTPNVPHYEGFETFNARLLHANDFRDAREFNDEDILIPGTSYSAEDIGSHVGNTALNRSPWPIKPHWWILNGLITGKKRQPS